MGRPVEPSPAGAFAYNTILVDMRKTELVHRPGWDRLATARFSGPVIFELTVEEALSSLDVIRSLRPGLFS